MHYQHMNIISPPPPLNCYKILYEVTKGKKRFVLLNAMTGRELLVQVSTCGDLNLVSKAQYFFSTFMVQNTKGYIKRKL